MDVTEGIRKSAVSILNGSVQSGDYDAERVRLEGIYGEGNVWDTSGLSNEFEVTGFLAPFCVVIRKSDNQKGTVMFQHSPRFYFSFQPYNGRF
jgi:hypothetical protein